MEAFKIRKTHSKNLFSPLNVLKYEIQAGVENSLLRISPPNEIHIIYTHILNKYSRVHLTKRKNGKPEQDSQIISQRLKAHNHCRTRILGGGESRDAFWLLNLDSTRVVHFLRT